MPKINLYLTYLKKNTIKTTLTSLFLECDGGEQKNNLKTISIKYHTFRFIIYCIYY